MAGKKQFLMADRKQGGRGCGSMAASRKDAKMLEPATEKARYISMRMGDHPVTAVRRNDERGFRTSMCVDGYREVETPTSMATAVVG